MEKVKERLFYIDNLRLLMIVFVVMHHLAVTYSGFGSWYYNEVKNLDTLSTIWFAFYLSFQQGYFMGLLFLVAGYFTAISYDRKGFGQFIKDRFYRLIIPALIYMVIINPFIGIVELNQKLTSFNISDFLSGTGVMWFVVALFFFSLIYGLVRLFVHKFFLNSNSLRITPSFVNAVILILIISVCAFLIRIIQPIGTSILNMQFSFFASYIALFIVGIIAYRNNLFSSISYKTGKRWLIWAIVLGFFSWFVLVVFTSAVSGGVTTSLNGGFTWESAGYSIWESFVAVAMCIGLITVFREKFNHQSKFIKTLSDNSFTVYMFHPLIIVAITLFFKSLDFPPIVKWLILSVICVPLCFAIAHFIFRKIPLLKNVL